MSNVTFSYLSYLDLGNLKKMKCMQSTYWAHRDALLPLTHAQAFFQWRALLQYQVPATVGILGSNTCTENTNPEDQASVQLLAWMHFWEHTAIS